MKLSSLTEMRLKNHFYCNDDPNAIQQYSDAACLTAQFGCKQDKCTQLDTCVMLHEVNYSI